MILWNIGIVCLVIELHQFTSGTPYVFLLYTSIESTCICKSFHFFFLRSESTLHFPHPAFGRSGCRLSNSTVIFLPYFLLQGIILILKCSRYFICSESIKKISIFAWYLVLFSFFQEINADSHRLHSRNWIFYL
jgi:hypothetical protein